ncbi:hypothetical protein MCHI_000082 [Candidatus Magnetoovum chiemensis]|nr:hypothetical protein MCHI_000082 [Candidatus Magnetoovum chiemensis]
MLIMKRVLSLFVVVLALAVAFSASAGEFADLSKKVTDARDALVTFLNDKDKRGEDQQKLVKDTADAVSAALSSMKAPAGKEAQFKELADTWNAFKKTREEEIVPLTLQGKDEEAKTISGSAQKERFGKIIALCAELDK